MNKIIIENVDKIQEETLRKIFSQYLTALEKGNLSAFLENSMYKSISDLENDISKFINNYATKEEKRTYVSIKARNRQDEIRLYQNYRFKHAEEVETLLNGDNKTCLEIFYSKNISASELEVWCNRYCLLHNVTTEGKKKLQSQIQSYRDFCKAKALEKMDDKKILREQYVRTEVLPESKKLIEDLIVSKKSVDFYCKAKSINLSDIKRSLKLIEEYDYQAYQEYIKKIRENESDENKSIATLALQMESMIKNGIEEDGYTREFDIVDYYMITKRMPKEFIKLAEEGLGSAVKILELKGILNKVYTNVSPLKFDENEILNNKVSVYIDGEERVITQEEKMNMLKFLKDNDIPQTGYTYRIMQLRLINNLTGRNIKKRTYS